jgi:hypothetical protein
MKLSVKYSVRTVATLVAGGLVTTFAVGAYLGGVEAPSLVTGLPSASTASLIGGKSSAPMPANATAPTASASAPAAAPVIPATKIGVNVTDLFWWNRNRAFANLAMTGTWQLAVPGRPWVGLSRSYQTATGGLKMLPAGAQAVKPLTQPMTGASGKTIRCTFTGDGNFRVSGGTGLSSGSGWFSFRIVTTPASADAVNIYTDRVNPDRPIENMDCRETGYPAAARFDPDYIAFVKRFKLIRFMGWQNINDNYSIDWATRKKPNFATAVDRDGVSLEDMVEVANLARADAWFTIPWNATPDYVDGFARYVRDRLNPGQTAYFEVANEVWNGGFAVAGQAYREGKAAGLSAEGFQAQLYRYAQRSREVMAIITPIFAENPKRIVRVIATQNANPWTAEQVLSFKDTAQFVDALATAPYFSNSACQKETNKALILACMGRDLDDTLVKAKQNKAVATKYKKRFLSYEGGQHAVIPESMSLLSAVSRDPEMYALYARYIRKWKSEIGDYLVLFASVSPVSRYGAWGLLEYPGQPLDQAPKMRAVIDSGLLAP